MRLVHLDQQDPKGLLGPLEHPETRVLLEPLDRQARKELKDQLVPLDRLVHLDHLDQLEHLAHQEIRAASVSLDYQVHWVSLVQLVHQVTEVLQGRLDLLVTSGQQDLRDRLDYVEMLDQRDR